MRVVVGYDGSSSADLAVDLVGRINWPVHTELRVITAYRFSIDGGAGIADATNLEELALDVSQVAHGRAEKAATRLARPGVSVHPMSRHGRAADVIRHEAETFAADLVVVGSRGLGPFRSALLGSVSQELVDQAPCPVLVARGQSTERLLFATDGSDGAGEAERRLRDWPMFYGHAVRVVSVAELAASWRAGLELASTTDKRTLRGATVVERQRHVEIAQTTAERLAAAGFTCEIDVRDGDSAQEITRAARANRTDLVVVGSRGRSGLSRFVLGSVSRKVVQHAPCSVLVIRELGPIE